MARPIEFRTKRAYEGHMGLKANKNLEIMAVVGDGGGVASVPNRNSFYWIRLVGDDDRLTQCFCNICALSDGDLIYVARAKDEKLSYYEFVRFIQNADADTTDPPVCPKFAQVVYVSENSCQFNTVGAAVTYINALVTGPAAGRLFLIKCQAGNFAEAGDVTIPQYVHLEGVGEASELEMGANTLILSDDTSVFHIVVESSDPTDAIRMNGVSNVVLRNVRGIQGAAADVFHAYGASDVEFHNCIAEATVGNAVGFHIGDTATAHMYYCTANDDTNFADALLLDASWCAAITRWCMFIGNGDDVHTGANSVWYYVDCHFYPTNVTLAADSHYTTPSKRWNQTLVVAKHGGDFQLLSEAITYINAQGDAAAGKIYGVLMLHGNYGEAGNVTIPQYVHVKGVGEGTEIEMGANSLLLVDDTSLQDVVVESSNASYAIGIVGRDNVILRGVHCIQTSGAGTPDCFHVSGASTDVYLYDCVAEIPADGVGFHILGSSVATLHTCTTLASANDTTTYGFQIGDTATATLDYCTADDDTYFDDALHLDNTALTCTTRWCTFRGHENDVNMAGTTITAWYHLACHFDPDNSTIAAASHFALPTKRFNQTLIVAEQGGDFQALSEAITYINAQGDAAAGKRYGIRVLAGNFAEAGNVTIPQYVDVAGMGENSRIEMGANQFDFDDYSSALDIVVTSSHATACLTIGGETDVELRNVKVLSLGTGFCFLIGSSTVVALYDCIAEAPAAASHGFHISGTASDIVLEGCTADTTNLTWALYVTNTASVTTKFCTFRGNVDVDVRATAEWIYHEDNFDPDNCTISGVAEPNAGQSVVYFPITKTAGAASDFTTVQAAIDWFKNRLLCALCKIDIVTGASYAETLVIEDVFCAAEGRLELEGDTRGMAGATWVDSAVITCQDANAGSGVCTLANAGAVITVTGAGGNPDFDADGWVNGDTVMTRDNAGAVATYTISATLNNTITLTVAAPALGNTGTSITLVPNTVIAPSGAGNAIEVIESRGILLDGLYLDATAGATGEGLYVRNGGECKCENVLSEADGQGFSAMWTGHIEASDGACTAIDCNNGFLAINSGTILATYGCAIGGSGYGFYASQLSYIAARYAVSAGNNRGFRSAYFGVWNAGDAYALDNTNYGFATERFGGGYCYLSRTAGSNGVADYYSSHNSYMFAGNTNVGGPTYSPAASDTEGNVYAIITWS